MFGRFAAIGALLGLLIPGALLLKVRITNVPFGMYELLAWPSSISLMANEQYEPGDPMIWFNMAKSIGLNVVWYVILATVAYIAFRAYRKFSRA